MALSDEQDKASFKGAASLEANFDPRDRIALYGAMKEVHETISKLEKFSRAILYRTSNTWMGKYMQPEIFCSKCEKPIPESEWLQADLIMTIANEFEGNGGAIWTCASCANAE